MKLILSYNGLMSNLDVGPVRLIVNRDYAYLGYKRKNIGDDTARVPVHRRLVKVKQIILACEDCDLIPAPATFQDAAQIAEGVNSYMAIRRPCPDNVRPVYIADLNEILKRGTDNE